VWTAELLVSDRPAVFLCRQSNAEVEMPYECVVSDVALIGLTEPSLPTVAATPSGSLAYQVREYLQAFIARDRACRLTFMKIDRHRFSTRCFAAETQTSLARAKPTVIEVWRMRRRSLVYRSIPAIDNGIR
jgi:hypothetical protein